MGLRNPATEQADRVLALLDNAGQDSTEAVYGYLTEGRCWRCNRHPEGEGSGLCDGCRSFMLGDSTTDPAVNGHTVNVTLTFDPGPAVAAITAAAEAIGRTGSTGEDALTAAVDWEYRGLHIGPGADITLYRDGEPVWSGVVSGTPSEASPT